MDLPFRMRVCLCAALDENMTQEQLEAALFLSVQFGFLPTS